MSMRYKGATLSATAPVTTGGESGTAPGAWTLEQQAQAQAAGLWPLGPQPKYVEDVFSTYLYQGASSLPPTIVNGIDLAGKGGMVWIKARNGATNQTITDTVRGPGNEIYTNQTWGNQSYTGTYGINSFNANGFSLVGNNGDTNTTAYNYTSWTFRKQPKFFDVVTWTGNSTAGRQIPHNLGSAPGFVVVKRTSNANNWICWHRALTSTQYIQINNTSEAFSDGGIFWNSTIPDATNLTLGNDSGVNGSGSTYVAYLFAHDAGGFGEFGTDNVVSCGSFTGATTINLGYEPQWVLLKRTSSAQNWFLLDTMRGWLAGSDTASILSPNLSDAEISTGLNTKITSTGFTTALAGTYIYIAIRRGPMKVPTDATKVFSPIATSIGSGKLTTGFPVDAQFMFYRTGGLSTRVATRLTGVATLPVNGVGNYLQTASTAAEVSGSSSTRYWDNTGFEMPSDWGSSSMIFESFQRAPGFFDEVCYTGTGSATTVAHNLGVVPELMIVKSRSTARAWRVYSSAVGNTGSLRLNSEAALDTGVTAYWNNTTPTSSVFTVGTDNDTNASGTTYVNYLFATCPGVSKVGSYSGTGATQTIACGFAAGARFVLVKRTDSTGDWYVWDSARGMVSGTDPSLLLNSTAAEVNANSIYAITTGFQIVSTAAGINANGGSYIFLAIA